MSKEAMKLALEALEYIDLVDNDRDFLQPHECYMVDKAITALREALAEQPAQQEPVACPTCGEYEPRTGTCGTSQNDKHALCNRNASQPAPRKPLTDEDRAILEAVRREMDDTADGNAPGHGHRIAGIWDEDNGDLAGKPCAWCLTWAKFTALLGREAAHGIKEKNT